VIVASPLKATPVATLEAFPTKIYPLFNVDDSLLLKVVQSVELNKPVVVPLAVAMSIVVPLPITALLPFVIVTPVVVVLKFPVDVGTYLVPLYRNI
jgi:hypothetical protein